MVKGMVQISRRGFVASAAAGLALGNAGLSFSAPASGGPKYRRYNAVSAQGQIMVAAYAKAIETMLKLPCSHPHNWFRIAFVHLLDCPHGNWWFYAWHRGYLGYFEETVRKYSGLSEFALPYWDWTELPEIPASMFDGVLTPADGAYAVATENIAVFEAMIRPALEQYWSTLSGPQLAQLGLRGYSSIDDVWKDVDGNGVAGNAGFAPTCSSRYLTRRNSKLDAKTAYDVSPFVIGAGLFPSAFWSEDISNSFTSNRTQSHNTQPNKTTKFSILEGLPHNLVHNYIGGSPPLDPGPFGNMTNFLSPVDPIFFMHHSNMDRLWDVWERKQQRLKLPLLPSGDDLSALSEEPFLFFVDSEGNYLTDRKAGEFLSMKRFDYDYEPGSGEIVATGKFGMAVKGTMIPASEVAGDWSATVPSKLAASHLDPKQAPLIAEVTFTRPNDAAAPRQFDVLINAPAGLVNVNADSPYYAGTLSFFGPVMDHMNHGTDTDATFAVPIPRQPALFLAEKGGSPILRIRVVPSGKSRVPAPTVKAVTIRR